MQTAPHTLRQNLLLPFCWSTFLDTPSNISSLSLVFNLCLLNGFCCSRSTGNPVFIIVIQAKAQSRLCLFILYPPNMGVASVMRLTLRSPCLSILQVSISFSPSCTLDFLHRQVKDVLVCSNFLFQFSLTAPPPFINSLIPFLRVTCSLAFRNLMMEFNIPFLHLNDGFIPRI